MTLRAHSLAGERARGLVSIASLAGVTILVLPSGCSKPTCDETLTCPYDEPEPDAGAPLHDGGDVPKADASDDVAEGDATTDAGDAGAATDADAATLGPRIVSISPAPGAKGIRADANIVVTFDRPMDKTKTSQAYQSTDIPTSAATLTWNTNGTQLTVNPTADLAYAGGVVTTTPDAVAARQYSFRVTTAARALDGTTLQQDVASSFTTLRRLAHGLVAKGDAVGTVRSNEAVTLCNASVKSFTADDYGGPYQHKILVTFDMANFPAGIVTFESASVGANQIGAAEGVYDTGVVFIDHIREPFPYTEPHTGFDSAILRTLGVFSTSANLEYKSVTALDALRDDYTARRRYSQYRLDNTFVAGTGQAYAQFDCYRLGFHLATVYLVP